MIRAVVTVELAGDSPALAATQLEAKLREICRVQEIDAEVWS